MKHFFFSILILSIAFACGSEKLNRAEIETLKDIYKERVLANSDIRKEIAHAVAEAGFRKKDVEFWQEVDDIVERRDLLLNGKRELEYIAFIDSVYNENKICINGWNTTRRRVTFFLESYINSQSALDYWRLVVNLSILEEKLLGVYTSKFSGGCFVYQKAVSILGLKRYHLGDTVELVIIPSNNFYWDGLGKMRINSFKVLYQDKDLTNYTVVKKIPEGLIIKFTPMHIGKFTITGDAHFEVFDSTFYEYKHHFSESLFLVK